MKEKEEQERKEYEAMKSGRSGRVRYVDFSKTLCLFHAHSRHTSGTAVDETSKIDTSNWLQHLWTTSNFARSL